jgi:hypothetical protein
MRTIAAIVLFPDIGSLNSVYGLLMFAKQIATLQATLKDRNLKRAVRRPSSGRSTKTKTASAGGLLAQISTMTEA